MAVDGGINAHHRNLEVAAAAMLERAAANDDGQRYQSTRCPATRQPRSGEVHLEELMPFI